ncbi:unnamed protein product, partial [Ectocarpus sp. 8 AP-2014]
MAMGTQTKFLIGLIVLINALVLINIRRASPELPRATGGVFRGQTQRRITPDAGRGDLSQQSAAASAATATSAVDVARPPNSQQQQQQQQVSPSAKSDPLIAVCAGSTTRGVPFPDEHSLALFRFLLPSLARTADCGFRYLAVVGYDVGDGFFDGAAGKAKTLAWFETEVVRPAALRGLSIELELVRVENAIKKPGPVFTAVTK